MCNAAVGSHRVPAGRKRVLQVVSVEQELNNRRDGAGPDRRGLGERRDYVDPEPKVLRDPKKMSFRLSHEDLFPKNQDVAQTDEAICQRPPGRYTLAMSPGTELETGGLASLDPWMGFTAHLQLLGLQAHATIVCFFFFLN